MRKLVDTATADPRLISGNPIFFRSAERPSRFDHEFNSQKGRGQGNALIGVIFVVHENDILKQVQAQQRGVTLKLINDDIAIFGPAAAVFGPNGQGGAFGSFAQKLKRVTAASSSTARSARLSACVLGYRP